MENKELEEMKAQLATLNNKLEKEEIVNEGLLRNTTKNNISKLQKRLIVRMIIIAVITILISSDRNYWSCLFWAWGIGGIVLNLYLYLTMKRSRYVSLNVSGYAEKISKTLKIYKKTSKILMAVFSSFFLLFGTYLLIVNYRINGAEMSVNAMEVFFFCFFITILISVIYYVINEVFVFPDIEIASQMILKDLGEESINN